jgi:hypothetical protein
LGQPAAAFAAAGLFSLADTDKSVCAAIIAKHLIRSAVTVHPVLHGSGSPPGCLLIEMFRYYKLY